MTLPTAYINRIATHVPPHDIHAASLRFMRSLIGDERVRSVFDRLAAKAQVAHRYSILSPALDPDSPAGDAEGVYDRQQFPSTGQRMALFEAHAPKLATETVAKLEIGPGLRRVSHVVVTSCTGMYAPGIDLDLVERCGLDPSVERTMVGFMGCYAAINGLKLAYHIVRSMPEARVLLVNLELCSLHFQRTDNLERLMGSMLFADGCAASLISAEPRGLAIERFHAAILPDTASLIRWNIRDLGFDMHLSGHVPAAISAGLPAVGRALWDDVAPASAIDRWAVHPGGRSILDAVQRGLSLDVGALATSRSVLERFGNMSSASVMFVLSDVLREAKHGERGCAMSFGPGMTAETMLFHAA